MLTEATKTLANQFAKLSLVARNGQRLDGLADEIENSQQGDGNTKPCLVTTISVDYSNLASYLPQLKEALKRNGPPNLVLAWMRTSARDAVIETAKAVSEKATQTIPFFDIRSSAASKPGFFDDRKEEVSAIPNIYYHKVALGCIRENGIQRWLTHPEICEGVLAAISKRADSFLVGKAL